MNRIFKVIKNKRHIISSKVVSENASSNVRSSDKRSSINDDQRSGIIDSFNDLVKRSLPVLLIPLLALQYGYADIIADPSAPLNQQPTILNTASGATQVNIQTPTAAGISVNQYTEFNTGANGTILNNSRTNTNTVTAGWVQANPWLYGGTAKAIVNQVNSSNPSNLTGNIEIAGSKADFIIANPSGISIDGATIINAGGTTLTTGTPLLNNGNLDGFNVNNGTVSIQGAGLNALGSDYTNILAHAAVVNAGIWAQNLKIVTGTNTVLADGTNIAADTPTAPAPLFAVDSSALGGMYANSITLIGTQDGVGVNNAGVISAATISIDTNGMLTNSGFIDGSQTTVKADTINNTGTGKVYGDFLALQAVTLNNMNETIGGISNSAIIGARKELNIGASIINNTNRSTILSLGNMYIGESIDENGFAAGKAKEINNLSATIESAKNMFLGSDRINNTDINLVTNQVIDSTVYTEYVNPKSGSGAGEWFLASDCYGILGKQDDNYFGVSEEMAKRDAMIQDYIDNNYKSYKNINNFTRAFGAYNNNDINRLLADSYLKKNNKEYNNILKIIDAAASEDYTILREYVTTSHTQLVSSDPARIISGGDMIIDGLLHNKDSRVIAGGTILTSQNPINEETKGRDIISYDGSTIERTTVESSGLFGNSHKRKWHGKASYDLADIYSELYTPIFDQNLEDQQDQINGALISALNIVTSGSNDLINSGTIMAANVVSLNSAGSINNDTGNIKAESIALRANDININRGNIQAGNAMVLDAANNIDIVSQTYSTSNTDGKSSFSRTGMQNNANIAVNNSDGLLLVNAGNNIDLNGANIINNGIFTQFQAGNDINLGTIQTSQQNNVIWNSKNHRIEGYSHEIGNTIQTNGDNTVIAGNDINVIAGTIDSLYGTTALMAVNNINILSGADTSNYDEATYIKTSSLLGTKKTTTLETKDTITSQATAIMGKEVLLSSGDDINIIGSNVISDNGTYLYADNDINILSSNDILAQTYFNEAQKNGVFGSGGLSLTIGTSKNSLDTDYSAVTNVGSMVGSLNGDVAIEAGNDLTVQASDILAGNDITATAKDINIINGIDKYDSSSVWKSKSSGLTVSLGGTIGNAANAMNSALSQARDASDRGNDRLTAAYTAKAALIGVQSGQSLYQDFTDVSQANKATQGSAIGISVSVGSSQSKATSNSVETAAVGSSMTAANHTILIAAGNSTQDSSGYATNGDINIIGSNISSKDISLSAARDINILAAANTMIEDSSNSSIGWALGANIGVSVSGNLGVSVFANANAGKGNSSGESTTYTETMLNAFDDLSMVSGKDTNIVGAIAEGNSIYADIGRDLHIESLQHSSVFNYKQSNASIGVEVPVVGVGVASGSISATQQKIDSDYASVNVQSGIIAGDGGFYIKVDGNTDLKGGAILSAASKELNSLDTASLTYGDIKNYAEYKASSSSIGISSSGLSNNVKRTLLSQAPQALNGKEKVISTTYATLSPSTVTIAGQSATDEQLQGFKTAQIDSYIKPIFDKQEVLDNAELASTLSDVVTLGSNVIASQLKRDDYIDRDTAIAQAEADLWVDSYLYGNGSEYDAYVQNPSVATLLSNEYLNSIYISDENKKIFRDMSPQDQAQLLQDMVNKGDSFGALSSQEAQWHNTQLSYGPGSDFDMATQALRGAASALAMGNADQALANLTQPYIANEIGNYFDKNTNETARALSHAALGAAVAYLSGNDPASGAIGAASGEIIAKEAMHILYPDKTPDELTLEEKENIRAVATLASGLVGAMSGGSFEDSATAAAAGYNAAVNNAILYTPGTFSNSTNIDEDLPDALKKFYEDNKFIPIDLGRDLGNNAKDRELLADKIVEVIIAIKQVNPDEPIRLVGHSHGGNVDKLVTQKLVDLGYTNIVDDVMFIDTPVRSDYVLNNNALTSGARVYNLYDSSDLVQRIGGNYFNISLFNIGEIGFSGQTINNNPRVQNIQIESPNNTNPNNLMNNAPILSNPIFDPYNGFNEMIEDHSNADSSWVIEQVEQRGDR